MSINDYKPRVIDQLLSRKLRGKGAVLIEGAKWCGKTSTGEQQAKSVIYMSDSARRDQYRIFVDSTPKVILDGETPRLIDEWQQTPKLWDMVRFEVDHRHGMGQFILTGSAVPAKLEELHHTGTGRIARLLMRPMSLWESGDSNGTISLKSYSPLQNPLLQKTTTTYKESHISFVEVVGHKQHYWMMMKKLHLIRP